MAMFTAVPYSVTPWDLEFVGKAENLYFVFFFCRSSDPEELYLRNCIDELHPDSSAEMLDFGSVLKWVKPFGRLGSQEAYFAVVWGECDSCGQGTNCRGGCKFLATPSIDRQGLFPSPGIRVGLDDLLD